MAPIAFSAAEPSLLTGFAASSHDRREQLRENADDVAAALGDPDSRFVLFSGDRPILALDGGTATVRHAPAIAKALPAPPFPPIYLGQVGGRACFAQAGPVIKDAIAGRDDLKAIDLRSLAIQGLTAPDDLGLLAQARSLLHWHERHRFCANCGAPTEMAQAGYRRDCGSCNAQHFPRTDPVSIMLAVDGDRCVLGRGPHFGPGMYSCLAGFIEPGETIENAVRREIEEEAGIRIGAVNYYASQPWPFPASLMIGCHAQAVSFDIQMDALELEDCRWFDRDEVALMLAGTHPGKLYTPPPMAIAHHLIRAFVES